MAGNQCPSHKCPVRSARPRPVYPRKGLALSCEDKDRGEGFLYLPEPPESTGAVLWGLSTRHFTPQAGLGGNLQAWAQVTGQTVASQAGSRDHSVAQMPTSALAPEG